VVKRPYEPQDVHQEPRQGEQAGEPQLERRYGGARYDAVEGVYAAAHAAASRSVSRTRDKRDATVWIEKPRRCSISEYPYP